MEDIDDSAETGPGPKKKRLREQIQDFKMDKRVGLYTNDGNPMHGIFKDPNRSNQRNYRKNLRQQISDIRKTNRNTPRQD